MKRKSLRIGKRLLALVFASVLPALASFGASGQSRTISPYAVALQRTNPISRDVVSKKAIGRYGYAVTYRYSVSMPSPDTATSYYPDYDMMRLEIGSGLSRYYSLAADRCDSLMFKARQEGADGVNNSSWMDGGRIAVYEDCYQNWPGQGILTVRMGIVDTEYEYSERMPDLQWTFIPDTAVTVLGYQCMAASTEFRGRRYTVWFAPDIPISAGPWKFCGLPGLIMAVEESSGVFSWEAVGLERRSGDIHIFDPGYDSYGGGVPKMKIRRINRRQALGLERKRWADPYGFKLALDVDLAVGHYEGDKLVIEKVTAANREQFALPEVPALELE